MKRVVMVGVIAVAIWTTVAQSLPIAFDQALQLLNDHCARQFGDSNSDQCRLQTNRYCHQEGGAAGDDAVCVALAVVQHQNSLDARAFGVDAGDDRRKGENNNGSLANPADEPRKKVSHAKRFRVRKAEKAKIKRLKALMNKKAEKRHERIQADPQVIKRPPRQRNPNARKQHSELSINDAEEYFQGDLELSDAQAKRLEEDLVAELEGEQNDRRVKRKIGKEPFYQRWNDRPISYDFADTIPDETKSKIRQAIKLWEENTCIRFQENGPNTDRLEFFDGGACSSYVGRTGGTQGISIATPGCDYVGIIAHEIGHSLGSFHEQARPDQDSHISVNYGNIPIGRWNNFQPVDAIEADTYDLPYDVGSVMHYGGFGFAINPNTPSINTNDENSQDTIGQRVTPSFLDYAAVNTAYNCNSRCGTNTCQHGGYSNPNDCNVCLCPDGFGGKQCETVQYSTCGGPLQASTEANFISSPAYPSSFTKGTKCIWLIKAQPGFKVMLEFVDTFEFQCEETCDKSFVEVKMKQDFRLTGYRFCCSTRPKKQFESETNEMVIIFDGKDEVSSGFKAKFWSNGGETSLPPPPDGQETRTPKPESKLLPTTPTETTATTVSVPPSVGIGGGGNKTGPPDCVCGEWEEWSDGCSQKCGGCGSITRRRKCNHEKCFDLEKRKCNFEPCPKTTNFLLNNHEFHLLWQGCCVGLFEREGKCGGLQSNGKGFIELLSSLFQDIPKGTSPPPA